MSECRQLSLFDAIGDRTKAVCMMDGVEVETKEPDDMMKRLVPTGELYVMVGDHPLVLSPTPMTPEQVKPEYRYFHYLVAGAVYSGIFVGKEAA